MAGDINAWVQWSKMYEWWTMTMEVTTDIAFNQLWHGAGKKTVQPYRNHKTSIHVSHLSNMHTHCSWLSKSRNTINNHISPSYYTGGNLADTGKENPLVSHCTNVEKDGAPSRTTAVKESFSFTMQKFCSMYIHCLHHNEHPLLLCIPFVREKHTFLRGQHKN